MIRRIAIIGLFATISAFISDFIKSVAALIIAAFDLFKPDAPSLVVEGWSDFGAAGAALDPSLQQSLRHEAGVPRLSAARNT
jgi:hypothetical protein